jgi:hypothetical protein
MEIGDHWDTYINDTLYAYKIRKHTTLGKSPYEAIYGIPPKTPAGIALGPKPNKGQRLETQQIIWEITKCPVIQKASKFKKNQQVLWKSGLRHNKLEQNLFGPYLILKCGPKNTYLLIDDYGNDLHVLVSGDKLQKYQCRAKGIGRRTVMPKGVTWRILYVFCQGDYLRQIVTTARVYFGRKDRGKCNFGRPDIVSYRHRPSNT